MEAMKFRAAAGRLGAILVAAALSVGIAATAQAATASAGATANIAVGIGVQYEIVTWGSGPTRVKCADVINGSTSPGGLLQVFHCNSNPAQLFNFVPTSNDGVNQFYQVMNVNSRLCFELPNESGANGTPIEQTGCVGFETEQWRFLDLDSGPGAFALVSKRFPSMCLTRSGSGFFPSDHDRLVLSACNFFGSQVWRLG